MMRFVAATNCSAMHPAETSLYAHLYAHVPSLLTTDQVQASSNSPCRPAMRVGTDSASRRCSVRSSPTADESDQSDRARLPRPEQVDRSRCRPHRSPSRRGSRVRSGAVPACTCDRDIVRSLCTEHGARLGRSRLWGLYAEAARLRRNVRGGGGRKRHRLGVFVFGVRYEVAVRWACKCSASPPWTS